MLVLYGQSILFMASCLSSEQLHKGHILIFSDILFVASTAILLFQIGFWIFRLRDIFQARATEAVVPAVRDVSFGEAAPLVSIIIPAYNEEAGIDQCLQSVGAQDYPNLEIIFVDDRSSDNTWEVANSALKNFPAARLLRINSRRQGWTGKCNALDHAVRSAKGSWLAFLDADSALSTSAISQCVFEAINRKVEMVTLTPRFVMRTFWERALQPALASMSAILYPIGRVNDPQDPIASANGMFYLIKRECYDAIGGHAAVHNLAVEDIGIGKRVKASGRGLLFANGVELLQTRMYCGFKETLCGWTRILSASMNYDLNLVFKYLFCHILMSAAAMIFALYFFVPYAQIHFPTVWFVLPALAVLLSIAVASLYCSTIGAPRECAPLMIVGQLFLICVFFIIPKKIMRREALQWRGTTYHETVYAPTALEADYSRSAPLSR